MTIGERIKARREELEMSQEELAKKVGYTSRSTINKIELNINQLKQSKILEFANALETTPEYLMGWHDDALKEFRKVERYGETTFVSNSLYKLEQENGQLEARNEVEEQIKMLQSRPDLKTVLSKSSKIKPEHIDRVIKILDTFIEDEQ